MRGGAQGERPPGLRAPGLRLSYLGRPRLRLPGGHGELSGHSEPGEAVGGDGEVDAGRERYQGRGRPAWGWWPAGGRGPRPGRFGAAVADGDAVEVGDRDAYF